MYSTRNKVPYFSFVTRWFIPACKVQSESTGNALMNILKRNYFIKPRCVTRSNGSRDRGDVQEAAWSLRTSWITLISFRSQRWESGKTNNGLTVQQLSRLWTYKSTAVGGLGRLTIVREGREFYRLPLRPLVRIRTSQLAEEAQTHKHLQRPNLAASVQVLAFSSVNFKSMRSSFPHTLGVFVIAVNQPYLHPQ